MSYCDSPADFAKYLLYIIVTTEIGILVAGGQPVKREAFADHPTGFLPEPGHDVVRL